MVFIDVRQLYVAEMIKLGKGRSYKFLRKTV